MNKTTSKIPTAQMVREAIETLDGKAGTTTIRDWVVNNYPGTTSNSVLRQIVVCTVNNQSRVHYPENQMPRRADGDLDFLFRSERGKVERYDSRLHGLWEIAQNDNGLLFVKKQGTNGVQSQPPAPARGLIGSEHLRDYLAKNLSIIEEGLELFVDAEGNDGIEYATGIGAVDILAVDKKAGFVVVQLHTEHAGGNDGGAILGLRNWVKCHLAKGTPVRAFLIGAEISERIRYALSEMENVFLREYEAVVTLRNVGKAGPRQPE